MIVGDQGIAFVDADWMLPLAKKFVRTFAVLLISLLWRLSLPMVMIIPMARLPMDSADVQVWACEGTS